MMECGRVRVRLGKVNSLGDVEERKIEVTDTDETNASPNRLMITMIHLISWPQQGLPHPSAITSLYDQLTKAQMRACSQLTVVMCRLDTYILENLFVQYFPIEEQTTKPGQCNLHTNSNIFFRTRRNSVNKSLLTVGYTLHYDSWKVSYTQAHSGSQSFHSLIFVLMPYNLYFSIIK